MVEKFFLALDFDTADKAVENGTNAFGYLSRNYSGNFVEDRVGVKLNQDLLTGHIDPRYRMFNPVFADLKISHGADTGERILDQLESYLPIRYVTVSANLGKIMLHKYVERGRRSGVDIVAWTVHTKTSQEDAERIYRQSINDAIFNLAQTATEAGCHAVVLEANMLEDERIRKLPIRKLVTGIRIEPSDKGSQQRVSSLEDAAAKKLEIDYAVISSRYISDLEKLAQVIDALK